MKPSVHSLTIAGVPQAVFPCAKQTVRCTLVYKDGFRIVGENVCLTRLAACPREKGEGYEKCVSVCHQLGHAETVAAGLATNMRGNAEGAIAYVEGHTYACDPCLMQLTAAGVDAVFVGVEPPEPVSADEDFFIPPPERKPGMVCRCFTGHDSNGSPVMVRDHCATHGPTDPLHPRPTPPVH